MGQYGNQPDFGTTVATLDTLGVDTPFPPSAIYVGQTTDNAACSFEILPVGNNGGWVSINGISAGTFLPIVVTQMRALTDVVKEDILLYR
jgi:hypothetical protein